MKLLLTSAGITNQAIANALSDLLGKPLSQTRAAFITTAKNNRFLPAQIVMFGQLRQLKQYKIGYTLVDPSQHSVWQQKLDAAELIIIGGGNTFHLLHKARQTGFDQWLKQHAADKVYMGTSAGSILLTPNIGSAAVGVADKNTPGINNLTGLGLVGFEVSPHTPEDVSIIENLRYSKATPNKMLLLDNHSAVQVDGSKTTIIGSGQWCQSGQIIDE